jgi:hypothetical protein
MRGGIPLRPEHCNFTRLHINPRPDIELTALAGAAATAARYSPLRGIRLSDVTVLEALDPPVLVSPWVTDCGGGGKVVVVVVDGKVVVVVDGKVVVVVDGKVVVVVGGKVVVVVGGKVVVVVDGKVVVVVGGDGLTPIWIIAATEGTSSALRMNSI